MKIYGYYLIILLFSYKLWISYKAVDTTDNLSFLPTDQFVISKNNTFVVLGSNTHPSYLFSLYLTVKRWKSLGIRSIVCFGVSKLQLVQDPTAHFVFLKVQELQAEFLFLPTELAPSHTISQTCRLYVSASLELPINDSSILITSDSDLWPISLSNHMPRKGQEIFAYHSHCCGFTHKPFSLLHWFRHYQISTIAASAHTWRELMGITPGWLRNGDDLSLRLYHEIGERNIKYGRPKPFHTRSWFSDQIILSEHLERYKLKNSQMIGELPIVLKSERISRENWPKSFENITLSNYREVHLLNNLYEQDNWKQTLPLMRIIFNSEEMIEIEDYYFHFLTLFHRFLN